MTAHCFHGLLVLFHLFSSISSQQWMSDNCLWSHESNTQNNRSLYIQVLLPCLKPHILSFSQIVPGIILGIEHNKHLLTSWKIEVEYHNTMCSNSLAPYQAVEVYKFGKVNVFLGPACDYALAGVARFVKYWNIPLLTAGGFASGFHNDKREFHHEFHLLTKTGLSYVGVSRAIIDMGRKFSWAKYKLLFQKNTDSYPDLENFCYLLLGSFAEVVTGERAGAFGSYNWEDGKTNESPREKAIRILKQEIGNDYAVILTCLPRSVTRDLFLAAEELNMIDSGEYVFINVELFANRNPDPAQFGWFDEDDEISNERLKRALTAVFLVSARFPDNTNSSLDTFFNELNQTSLSYFKTSYNTTNVVTLGFYDAVTVYFQVIREILNENDDIANGSLVTSKMRNRTFMGRLGPISMDINGNRLTDYSLLDFHPDTNLFEPIMHYNGAVRQFTNERGKVIHWPGGGSNPPLDTPPCGYDNAKCSSNIPRYVIAIISILCASIVFSIIACLIYRRFKKEANLLSMSWKVRWEDIKFIQTDRKTCWDSRLDFAKTTHFDTQSTLCSTTHLLNYDDLACKIATPILTGFYKGTAVAVKKIHAVKLDVNRALISEMNTLKQLHCDHLVRFVGACVDSPNQCLVTEYCSKGSLHNILDNNEIQLDWTFRVSLMNDIVKGMNYLHNSDIKSHGHLTSFNCVVDSRFILKISDFGLISLRNPQLTSSDWEDEHWQRELWTAPELLRSSQPPLQGTQKGDVFSFAIILHEIIVRQGPFNLSVSDLSPMEVVQKVTARQSVPFRPSLETIRDHDDIVSLMVKCWLEDPDHRPDFRTIQSMTRAHRSDENILDNLLARMEHYANNLETLVEERTADYLEEKKKCEEVVYQLLPRSVACNLINGKSVAAEAFDEVSIYFSDIVGFTTISAASTPMQVVELLNDLYTCFDSIIESFDVYKVETIGDAYMVVSGLPTRNGNAHANHIARMSLALLKAVDMFKIRHKPEEQLKLRIGLHSGPCVAGIVGSKMPRYCLFGDTVNTASRMESTGEALKIHISSSTKDILDTFDGFVIEYRGEVEAKGKGKLVTYWLLGEKEAQRTVSVCSRHCEDLRVEDLE